MGIAIPALKDDLNLELLTREPDEYLLYPRQRTTDPMDPSSLQRWFKKGAEPGGPSGVDRDARIAAFRRRQPVSRNGRHREGAKLLRHEVVRLPFPQPRTATGHLSTNAR